MSKPETVLARSVRLTLESAGCWVERLQSGQHWVKRGRLHCCSAGTPDFMVLSPVVAFLEIKMPDGKLSKDQVAWHRRAKTAGLEVYVVSSVTEAAALAVGWLKRKYDDKWDDLGLGG